MKRLLIFFALLIISFGGFAQSDKKSDRLITINNSDSNPLKTDLQIKTRLQGVWPRLLMNQEELKTLRARLNAEPELRKVAIPANQPKPDFSASGSVKLTPELTKLERAAFFWYISREERFRTTVSSFLPLVEKVLDNPVTLKNGTNAHDLNAGFTLRWLALTYDWLHESWPAHELATLRKTLALQASLVYEEMLGYRNFTYDQNHGYIPVVGLGLAGFVLWGEEEKAPVWVNYSRDYMDRSTRVLGGDGFYYEGPGYYSYAFEWQTLYAVALLRVTGQDWTRKPVFRNLEKYIAHCTLPGRSFIFEFGDWGSFKGQKYYGISWPDRYTQTSPGSMRMNLAPLLTLDYYSAPDATRSNVIRWLLNGTNYLDLTVLGKRSFPFEQKDPDNADLPASHYFPDNEALFWRSSWSDPDATAVMFKCGPSHGHHAAPLRIEFSDWRENSGHVHPDAGQFLIWTRRKFVAGDTGYTGKKYTKEHNSILIDGEGQWRDGRYHVYQGLDYRRLNQLHLENVYHNAEVMAATAVLDSAYNPNLKLQKVRRHFMIVKGKWILIHDEALSPEPRTLSWLWHTDQQVVETGKNKWHLDNSSASATLFSFTPLTKAVIQPAIVLAYGGVPESGEDMQRGWRMELLSEKSTKPSLLNAMVLNPKSINSASAELISPNEVRLRDAGEEAILGVIPTAGGISWSYRFPKQITKRRK